MLAQLQDEFERYDIDITQIPLTLDSWFVAEPLRQQRYALGFNQIIIAGKGTYTLTINDPKQPAAAWKKGLMLESPRWGMEVSSCRVWTSNPTFGP